MRIHRTVSFLILLVLVSAGGWTRTSFAEEIANWSAPPTWSPARAAGISTMAATSPLPFIAISPCRVADTRGNGAPIQGGIFTNSQSRNWTVWGICGIPTGAAAISANITVTGSPSTIPQGAFLLAWRTGEPPPPTAIMTYGPTQTISNAAVIPLNGSGQMTINVSHSTHIIMDVNGYYAGAGVGISNTFLGRNAGNFTMTGDLNTAIGTGALSINTSGGGNTAVGMQALASNGTGSNNTGVGRFALVFNTEGEQNTALGDSALFSNTIGDANTAIGSHALLNNTEGTANTAVGAEALRNNLVGVHNTGVGIGALLNSTANRNTALGYLAGSTSTSNDNVAIGYQALVLSGGGGNIAIGSGAGAANTSGGFNMYLGNEGVASESTTIRIGSGLQHTRMFVAGVLGSLVTGTPVLISGTGQLGVAASSARFKEDVRDMGEASDRLMKLRPVSFRYKGHPADPVQFGLIAEEVDKVLPELVLRNSAGDVETVLYNEMPAMLLNELQKQQRRVESQSEEIDALKEQLRKLEERLSEAPRP